MNGARRGEPPVRADAPLVLVALAVVLVPHAVHIPLWLSAGALVLFLWRVAISRGRAKVPPRWLRLTLTAAAVLAVLMSYDTLFGKAAGTALLVAMISLKLLELEGRRDALVALLLGYFLLAALYLHTQSFLISLYTIPAVVALTAAVIGLHHHSDGGPATRQQVRLAGSLALQAVPIMVVLFVLFPRPPQPLMGLGGEGALTGLSDTMSPGDISRLYESQAVVFRAEFAGPPPPEEERYFRALVLGGTDGRQWHRLPVQQAEAPPLEPAGEALHYELVLEPHSGRWLPALEMAASVPAGARMSSSHELLAEEPLRRRTALSLTAWPRWQGQELSAGERALYLQLPGWAHPRAQALADAWRAQHADDSARVRAALEWFREQPFFYTHVPPLLPNDPVDEFLFETQSGFCEHYAGAFVALMRAAGVPARVVTGYLGGEYNPVGDYLVVRQSHAHAWAEVWLDGRGWTRVDPTHAVAPERVDTSSRRSALLSDAGVLEQAPGWLGAALRQARHARDTVNHRWNRWVLGYTAQRQARVLDALGLDGLSRRAMAGVIGGIVVVLLLGVALWLAVREPPVGDPASRLYGRFTRKLARRGLVRAPGEAPLTYAQRVGAARPDLARHTMLITRLYCKLRYTPRPPRNGLLRLAHHVTRFRA
ncbi:DUF3488 domain-containing transglutaminase family protein [Ectothiorhodospiraceae bacterium 2226]|nr:DUF3488 domain-containing transglutaminase family protein [Ectothiorhodospiraceae bacterium 2226]